MLPKGTRKRCDLVLRWKLENRKKRKKEIRTQQAKIRNVTGRLRWCVRLHLSCVWLCPAGSDSGGRMSQVDEVAGSLNTSKHTRMHARTHTHSLPAGPTAATQKTSLWVPASHPHLLYWAKPVKNWRRKREKAESMTFEVRWKHKKKKKVRCEQRSALKGSAYRPSKGRWENTKEKFYALQRWKLKIFLGDLA